MYLHMYVCTYVRTYVRTYIHTYIHTYKYNGYISVHTTVGLDRSLLSMTDKLECLTIGLSPT